MVKDIICGMQIDETKVSDKSSYKDEEYSFCSPACKENFDSDPEKYIKIENENK